MLEIIRYNEDEYEFPCLIVLGCFDAVHTGHAELLKKAKLQAKINGLDLGVMLFSEGKGGRQVFTFEEKLAVLEQYNVKFVLRINYDEGFKKTKPLDFLHCIEDKINVKAYMSGKDFRFGEGAKGKSSTLKNYAEDEENGVWYMPVKDVMCGADKISTTLVKKCLEEGDVTRAEELLGRYFSVKGTVVQGVGRGGQQLGFPTLNINYPENKFEVKYGVYSVKCTLGDKTYYGLANYGARPTFGEESPLLEVYLDGFDGDLYGSTVCVEFVAYIRDIRTFSDGEALKAQLESDLAFIKTESTVAVEKNNIETEKAVFEELAVAAEPESEQTAENIGDTETGIQSCEVSAEPAMEAEEETSALQETETSFEITESLQDEERTENLAEEGGDYDGFYDDYEGDIDEEFSCVSETLVEAAAETDETPESEENRDEAAFNAEETDGATLTEIVEEEEPKESDTVSADNAEGENGD